MTPQRKAEIETLLAHITPGEWTWRESFFDPAYPVAAYSDLRVETQTPGKPWNAELAYVLQPLTTGVILGRSTDIAFIAAAPGIVRELLKEVERLQNRQRMYCPVCGGLMDEGNFGYHCRECGHTIELD